MEPQRRTKKLPVFAGQSVVKVAKCFVPAATAEQKNLFDVLLVEWPCVS